MKPVASIAVAVFALVALAHLLRMFLGWEVTIGGVVIPQWVSGFALVITGGLAIMLFRESRK